MDKIVSIKQLSCGWEEFDFSSLYRECKLGVQRLPVSVFMIEHRKKGLILLNTGCSMRIRKNPAAYSKYISHHKLSFTEKDTVTSKLKQLELDPIAVKRVLLSQCDPECCGGLGLLPKYELHSTARVLAVLTIADPKDNVMKSTLPDDNVSKSAAGLFRGKSILAEYFKWVYDVFGDGSVLEVDIGGHSNAMAGFYFPEKEIFFAADASVDERAIYENLIPTDKLLSMQYDADEYLCGMMNLRKIHKDHPEVKLLFSHSEAQEL